jgi:hypothetical protein
MNPSLAILLDVVPILALRPADRSVCSDDEAQESAIRDSFIGGLQTFVAKLRRRLATEFADVPAAPKLPRRTLLVAASVAVAGLTAPVAGRSILAPECKMPPGGPTADLVPRRRALDPGHRRERVDERIRALGVPTAASCWEFAMLSSIPGGRRPNGIPSPLRPLPSARSTEPTGAASPRRSGRS